jgi:arabinan endo-1,5-alpha-L-arabinosidase
LPLALAALTILALLAGTAPASAPTTYQNPLPIQIPETGGRIETFADPAVIRGDDGHWYAYGTSDPLNGADRDATGALRIHRIPMARSDDLVRWTYVGDAFAGPPAWAAPTSGQWAPEVRKLGGRYVLYYTATDAADAVSGEPGCGADSAIGVATAPTPTGPWIDSGRPVVAPRRDGRGCNFKWTYDPALIETRAGPVLYYGSYRGGIEARRLSADGLRSFPRTTRRITTEHRYEGAYVIRRHGWYWLFGSATDCCRGAMTGYSLFVGRSRSPFGPFVDRLGVPLNASRVGGTPVISMNGNRWVGGGHNAVATDAAGQDWLVYHAIDRFDPYLSEPNPYRITKRPMLVDRLDWPGGWPSVRSGRWASDTPQRTPAVGRGDAMAARGPAPVANDRPASLLRGFSTEFSQGRASAAWRWIRRPAASLSARPGHLRFPTQNAELFGERNTASLFAEPAPPGDFIVEVKLDNHLPEAGVFNFQQAGVAIYEDDDRFVKLAHIAIGTTRQTEWATEVPAAGDGRRYGNTVVGPPAGPGADASTWLRIVRHLRGGDADAYTAYSSVDGRRWVRGGTWRNTLDAPRIALFAMGGAGHTADFDYVRVFRVAARR